jgi:rod shape-determining protein MreD
MIERLIVLAEARYTRLILVGLLVLSLQTTIFNELRPFGVCLQVMLLLAASCGLAKGSQTGAVAGFIIGLLYDMVLTTPMGLCAAVFAVVGYLAGFVHSFVHESTWWSRMLASLGVSIIGMIILPIAFTITGAEGVLTTQVFLIAIVVAVFNSALSLPAEWLCNWAIRDETSVR